MPAAVLEGSVETFLSGKQLAIGEGKGTGPGEYQLLGAVIKCWSINGVYPIGKCVPKTSRGGGSEKNICSVLILCMLVGRGVAFQC